MSTAAPPVTAAAAHHLPHMSEADLDRFILDSTAELNLTPIDAECFRMRRRRRSVELHMDADDDVAARLLEASSQQSQERRVKIVVLGDDLPSKMDALELFALQGGAPVTNSKVNRPPRAAGGGPLTLDIFTKTITVATEAPEGEGAALWQVEVWVPEVTELHRFHRQECLHGADAIVLTYSVKSRMSLDDVSRKWAAEIASFTEANAAPGSVEIPILLVGLDAEVRNAKGAAPSVVAVSAAEAVQMAQDMGAAKYMEVFADNAFHVQEVFSQAVHAVVAARQESGLPQGYLNERATVHRTTFVDTLTTAAPVGAFDLVRRAFTMSVQGGAVVDFTVDGTDPATSSTKVRYTAALMFERPFPAVVKAIARSRCRYASPVVEFAVPQESPAPRGYFDVCSKVMHLFVDTTLSAGFQLRYTTDGSDPTASSALYAGPILLDGSVGVGPWKSGAQVPRTIKAICVGNQMFRSRIVNFDVPTVLEVPKIHYLATSGTLTIECAMPAGTVAIRYTLDGSVPTFTSPLYTRPVMLPKDGPNAPKRIRAAVFPLQYFPSAETSLDIATQQPADTHAFVTNRSAMTRIASSLANKEAAASAAAQPILMAPGSRGASSKYLHISPVRVHAADTPTRTPRQSTGNNSTLITPRTSTPTKSNHAVARGKSPTTRSVPTPLSPAVHSNDLMAPSPSATQDNKRRRQQNHGTPAAIPTPRQPSPPRSNNAAATPTAPANSSVNCAATDNVVTFDFEQPIALSYITVATPGNGRGPAMYEIYATTKAEAGVPGADNVLVGGGHLDDFDGLQTLHVKPTARLQPITHVKCVFLASGAASGKESLFQINDLKIHGKPFRRHG